MRQVQGVRWLIAAVAVLGVAGLVQADPTKSEEVVKFDVTAGKPAADGTQVITISLDIDPQWHLYANPVGNELLETAATKVTIDGVKAEDVKVDYPKGEMVKDKDLGTYFKYEGKVQIKATVKRPNPGSPLKVAVKVQACDPSRCLKPSTVTKSVD